ncbi:MAG: response regulator [Clostridia bacterium]|nr:response regulator [Clostridia bacterium]
MLKLIVVDDEQDARDRMVRFMDKEKYGIRILGTASNGPQAIRMIRENVPDIVLIDVEMAGMSGLDVMKAVYEDDALSQVVFIIVSSHDKFSYAQEAMRLGAKDYLLKPFTPSDICNAIYRAAKHIRSVHPLIDAKEEAPARSPALLPFLPGIGAHMDYPGGIEQEIVHALHISDDDAAQTSIRAFSESIQAFDPNTQLNYFVILYVEICRFALARNVWPEDFALSPEASNDPALFCRYIQTLCHALCQDMSGEKRGGSALNTALRYIDANYASALTLESVAQAAYVSPAYLSTLFSQSLGMHFVDCIHKVRIENALKLLREQPHLKNYEVGEAVGYTSYKHFAKCFKQVMHMTISQYQGNIPPADADADGRR